MGVEVATLQMGSMSVFTRDAAMGVRARAGFALRPFVRGLVSPAVERDCVAMVRAGSALPVQEGQESQAEPVLAGGALLAASAEMLPVVSTSSGSATQTSRSNSRRGSSDDSSQGSSPPQPLLWANLASKSARHGVSRARLFA